MIAASELSKWYGRTPALDDIDLTIPAGGVTALVGPNGSGKSTLIKLCVGFERPTSGTIEVFGIDPVRDRPQVVAQVGYVPQVPALYRDLSVEGHLRLARFLRPSFDPGYARDRLDALGIPLKSTPGRLSGGQAAQVSLALALGTRARLLLLDEPLASLDPLARREFLAVVSDAVASDGISVVLSSHVLSEVEDVADRLLVLTDGVVLLHEPIDQALAQHRVVENSALVPSLGRQVIAVFPARGGSTHALVTAIAGIGRAATLEEVVLGYLASARSRPTDADAAVPS